jgi:5-(carboxyamino)imidazole ribonucleotide mutase
VDDTPLVGIVVETKADLPVMEHASDLLRELAVAHTIDVMSAHHHLAKLSAWASGAVDAGYKVLIAGAGGTSQLPGVVAASTTLPVIGVPCLSEHLGGAGALYATAQAPSGAPVATVGIDDAGNAAILAVQILATADARLAAALADRRAEQATKGVEHREIPADAGEGPGGFGFRTSS